MKVEARVLDVDSTLEGERVGMTIDESAMAHIMSILTDLYSDPELAVIREYSTNAFDAHVEAGVTQPIEITLPTPLAPFLRIRDFGTGLDADDIREIYSRYGASSKRNSNDVVGMLGLGCKSALTYTDQFTLSGVKDGICTQVSVSRDEDGGGSMTIVDQYETDDPSGVEIIVPAKSYNSFEDKAKDFFRFWPEGTVLVNGAAPKRIDGIRIADDLLLTKEVEESVVVMGNVAYPWPTEDGRYNPRYDSRWPVVAFVDIGSVNFTPSRESLMMSAKTKATINVLEERIKTERDIALRKMIEEATTAHEAIKVAESARDMGLKMKGIQWQGKDMPDYFTAPDKKSFVVINAHKVYRQKDGSKERQISVGGNRKLWLVGFTGDSFSPYKRQKLDQWIKVNDIDVGKKEYSRYNSMTKFVLCETLPDAEWIDPATVYQWKEVQDQKIVKENKAPRRDGRPTGAYKGYVDGRRVDPLMAEDIVTGNPIFYATHCWIDQKIVQATYSHYTVVEMGANRVNKFKRDFPTAVSLHDHNVELAKKWTESLTPDDLLSIHLHRVSADVFKLYDPKLIDDPEFAKSIVLATQKSKAVDLVNIYHGYAAVPTVKWDNPLDKYPLLHTAHRYGSMNKTEKQHAYVYINAVYAAEGESK